MTDEKPMTLDEAHDAVSACAEMCEEMAEHVETARDKLADVADLLTPWSAQATARLRESGNHDSKADVQAVAEELRERVATVVADMEKQIDEWLVELRECAEEAEELRDEVEEAKE